MTTDKKSKFSFFFKISYIFIPYFRLGFCHQISGVSFSWAAFSIGLVRFMPVNFDAESPILLLRLMLIVKYLDAVNLATERQTGTLL